MQQFTPLPLRARSVLELIDTALKVYKQYFLLLIAWSAGINLLGALSALLPALAWVSYLALLLIPFKLSVAACCVAGAVRGQNVTFSQSWEFSKPRYGSMLGWLVVGWIIGFLGFLLLLVPGMVLFFLLVGVSGGAGAIGGGAGYIAGMVFAVILILAAMSVGMVLMYAWAYFVSLVACMEELRAGQGPLGRSYDLLRGQWKRLIGLSTVLGVAALMLMLAAMAASGIGADIENLRRSITGGQISPELLRTLTNASVGISFVMMFFEPVSMLSMVLFYLDVRVRKEALDLEWASHQAQPIAASGEMPVVNEYGNSVAPSAAPSGAFGAPSEPAAPANFGDFASVAPPVAPPVPPAPAEAPMPSVFPSAVPWQNLVEETPLAQPLSPAASMPLPGDVATVICPQCQSVSPATSVFCMACGTRLQDDGAV